MTTLAPTLMQVVDRINAVLLPMVGEPRGDYVEFDLSVKLQGSFDERAQVMQSSVGGPFMTRAEARSRFNLPFIDGTDELIVPMNVTVGGLASPRDTDPTQERYNAGDADHKCGCCDHKDASEIRYKAEPLDEESVAVVEVYRSFFERQARSVLPKIRAAKSAKADAPWWDVTRWDKELADDLFKVVRANSEAAARRALRGIGVPDAEYDPDKALEFLREMCEYRATYVNQVTRDELERSLELEAAGAEGMKATPEGVFENAVENRSVSAGTATATAVDGWSALEAARQSGTRGLRKRWVVTSSNPRKSHAARDGETVPIEEKFSGYMEWPGDWAGGPDEVCGCQCTIEVVRDV